MPFVPNDTGNDEVIQPVGFVVALKFMPAPPDSGVELVNRQPDESSDESYKVPLITAVQFSYCVCVQIRGPPDIAQFPPGQFAAKYG